MGIRQAKMEYITASATTLFLQHGVAGVTVKDITAAVGVGEATIYRYFSTKQNLLIAAAARMAGEIHRTYFNLDNARTGLDKMRAFYGNFVRIYLDHPEYYRFIFEFDATVQAQGGLETYENTLLPYLQDYLAAYELGRRDGSVSEVADVQLFYLATTHALMGLCKKLTMDQVVLQQDRCGVQEVQTLIDTIMFRLQNL